MKYFALLSAAAALGASLYGTWLTGDVREMRQEFQQRQTYINESAQYRQLNDQMIKALANVASSTGDEAIREMLASEGVTFKLNESGQLVNAPQQGGKGND